MAEIKLEQRFNRRALGFLWAKRSELDPGQESIINSLYKNRKKGEVEGCQVVTYKLSSSKAGKLGYGRLYGTKGALETLERECRGTICREYYYDIDVANAHPVILAQFAKRYFDYDLAETNKYCFNRDKYLSQVSDNRDDAKSAIIKVLYGGKPDKEFLMGLYKEVKTFTKFLTTQERFIELFKAVQHEKNMYGTFLSYIAQTEERKIMLAMRDSLERQGWKVDVLAYDGVMIRKEEGKVYSPAILRTAEADIERATEYKIFLTNKEFEYFDIPVATDEEIERGVSLSAYNEMKSEFEKTHFYYTPTNTYAEINSNGAITFYEKAHAFEYFGLKWLFNHSDKFGDYAHFFPLWLKDPKRTSIRMIDYKPTEDPSVYVQPLKFAYESSKAANEAEVMDLFDKLLSLATCNEPELYDYLLKWLAHMMQRPFDLPGVAIVLTGGKGAGKDTLGDFVCQYLIGDHLSHNYTSNEQFFEKHDVNRKGKFFVKLEEADSAICGKNQQTLKAMITANLTTVNPKGEKAITTPNYSRFFFTTNDAVPVNIGENERRFVLLRTDNKYIGNIAFWKQIRKVLMTPEAGYVVGKYLMSVDISNFEVRTLPANSYHKAMTEEALSSEERFMTQSGWDGSETTASDLFEAYIMYCAANHLPHCRNSVSFGKKLGVLFRDNKIKKRMLDGKSVYYKD
jgi:hypothetical protein